MTTASDILTRSAKALGYLGRTEVLSAADANDSLVCFNALLDSWSNEALMSYVELQRNFPMVAGQQQYTIGTGGNINSTRPYDVTSAYIRDNNSNDYPMQIFNQDQWDKIGLKTITSQIPDTLFYDSQYPLGIINIFPIPLVNYTVYFNSTTDQVDFTSLTQSLSLPVGYERAFVLNLALDMMSAGFPCLLVGDGLAQLRANAAEAKGNIKRANIKEVVAEFDSSIISKSNATYNIYSDSSPRG
jgi:hypothetical protein